jgi:hypothetical protein
MLSKFSNLCPLSHLIAQNVAELIRSNHGISISIINEACHIDDVSRGSILCLENYYFHLLIVP